jgi:glycerophosphoryl diester phosphodiesterase
VLTKSLYLSASYQIILLLKKPKRVKWLLRIIPWILVWGAWNDDFGNGQKACVNEGKEMVFAHRGLHTSLPENSASAFEEAFTKGIRHIETDVMPDSRGELMLFHDKNALRLTGIDTPFYKLNDAFFARHTLLHEGVKTNEKILKLQDYLEKYGHKGVVYLDIKVPDIAVADKLIALLNTYSLTSSVLVSSADILFISYIRLKAPHLYTVLEGMGKDKKWVYYLTPKRLLPDYFAGLSDKTDARYLEFLTRKKQISRYIVYGNFQLLKDKNLYDKVLHKIEDL